MNEIRTPKSYYDSFYSKGGWKYINWQHRKFLEERIVSPLKLQGGFKLLDLGCGMGVHSNLFSELGFKVVGVDSSETGINYAKNHFSKPEFFSLNAMNLSSKFKYESFDIIFVRGMSWYHYELNGINKYGIDVPSCTKELFRFLTKNGLFILQIKTDFSGKRPENGIHYNKLEDYVKLFDSCGEVIFISDYSGKIIRGQRDTEKAGKVLPKKGIIISTRKT